MACQGWGTTDNSPRQLGDSRQVLVKSASRSKGVGGARDKLKQFRDFAYSLPWPA